MGNRVCRDLICLTPGCKGGGQMDAMSRRDEEGKILVSDGCGGEVEAVCNECREPLRAAIPQIHLGGDVRKGKGGEGAFETIVFDVNPRLQLINEHGDPVMSVVSEEDVVDALGNAIREKAKKTRN